MSFIDKLLVFEEAWSDDKKRKSYLLNFINFSLIIFLLLILIIRFFGEIFFNFFPEKESFFSLFVIFSILSLMIFLVKKGFVRIIAFLIVALLLFSSLKGTFSWGIDLYTVDIMYPFIILLSAILIGSKFSFFVLILISLGMSMIYFLQVNNYIPSNCQWRSSIPSFLNLITIIVIYSLMTFLSWLSSREIEKSLQKEKDLAKKLKLQNENLEMIVEERTKELKSLQIKQLTDLVPLIDLGKMSAGFIHDVKQPLSVLSLILQAAERNSGIIKDMDQAFLAIDKINDLSNMGSRKVFSKVELEIFNLNKEIKNLLKLFSYKSQAKGIKIIFIADKHFNLHADRRRLNQILANLILNAIESYTDVKKTEKNIFIKLVKKPKSLLIQIKDYGSGIKNVDLDRIFEPNFSSKNNSESLGLGLYVSQEAMKMAYQSEIRVESEFGSGSTFTLLIKNRFIFD